MDTNGYECVLCARNASGYVHGNFDSFRHHIRHNHGTRYLEECIRRVPLQQLKKESIGDHYLKVDYIPIAERDGEKLSMTKIDSSIGHTENTHAPDLLIQQLKWTTLAKEFNYNRNIMSSGTGDLTDWDIVVRELNHYYFQGFHGYVHGNFDSFRHHIRHNHGTRYLEECIRRVPLQQLKKESIGDHYLKVDYIPIAERDGEKLSMTKIDSSIGHTENTHAPDLLIQQLKWTTLAKEFNYNRNIMSSGTGDLTDWDIVVRELNHYYFQGFQYLENMGFRTKQLFVVMKATVLTLR
ncbi:hypothetical protein SPOG_05739 [Schizosaccharomyces cryophilus OY26]|uniref:Uncharacterized protein n=1 Tax=Schizosaccharomyces cryophilus (strain OY26 / ATCC MYA-4695 / CBS 11777 / NBRC 106824 / NRRL Y48691) TaxID=653667 RepID=S9X595_SCHCR|nr:uncharacterized protein SPOG_05739 [Schizosaccharomyces cryophilus OY26]EPY52272.1 hypothetical protein SPOG_05739 [Schizosaccharomyces cryophilus OY26]